jgi:hypothetical protein
VDILFGITRMLLVYAGGMQQVDPAYVHELLMPIGLCSCSSLCVVAVFLLVSGTIACFVIVFIVGQYSCMLLISDARARA